jgi:2-polyprenyl-6-methoxyphenol hydroxylase-like FAD-dependent oxidoreductase
MRSQGKPPERIWNSALKRSKLVAKGLPDKADWTEAKFFSASPGIIDQPLGLGWAAVGDAAMHSDPIEGRGITRALCTAHALATLITAPTDQRDHIREKYLSMLAQDYKAHCRMRHSIYQEAQILGEKFLSQLNSFC